MASSLPTKRRRLNGSLSSVNKPFVSPLKTTKGESTPLRQSKNATGQFSNLTADDRTVDSKISTPKYIDPQEIAAQSALTALELQIRNIRNEIDTLNQAARISASTTDDRVEELTQKWKVAAQGAADDVFESVKDRVAQMGGVRAWRESEKNKHNRSNDLDEPKDETKRGDSDYEFDSDGELLSEDKLEYRKAESRKARREMEQSVDVDESKEDGNDDTRNGSHADHLEEDNTFTMDMMLRSLNIELDVIGYDKNAQIWVT